jgi:hypothetical protein
MCPRLCEQTILAALITRFSLELKPGAKVEPKLRVTMRPWPALPMLLHKVH